jgi:hypothetical protein
MAMEAPKAAPAERAEPADDIDLSNFAAVPT